MKKYFIVIIVLTVCFFSAKTQNYKNSYRIGAHFVNLEDDKFACDFYYNQYNRKITKRIEVGIGLGLISYNHDGKKELLSEFWGAPLPSGVEDVVVYPGNSNFSSQWLLNANISYAPIQRKKFQLKLGCGFSMTHYTEGHVKGGMISARQNLTTGKFEYSAISENSYGNVVSFAYNFFIEPEISLTPRFFISARVSPYFFFDNLAPYIYSAGVTAGIRF